MSERRVDKLLDGARAACAAAAQLAGGNTGIGKIWAHAPEKAGVGAAEAVDGLLRITPHIEFAGRRRSFTPIAFGRFGSEPAGVESPPEVSRYPETRL
jgi:hypothetical protein